MTCVVGIASRGIVYLGADTCTSEGEYQRAPATLIKTANLRPEVIVGGAGKLPFISVLTRLKVGVPPTRGSVEAWVESEVVGGVCKALKERDVDVDGELLVGVRGGLYYADDEGGVYRVGDGDFAAIGEGAQVASGHLDATSRLGMKPLERLQRALKSAAKFCGCVAPPFTYATTRQT